MEKIKPKTEYLLQYMRDEQTGWVDLFIEKDEKQAQGWVQSLQKASATGKARYVRTTTFYEVIQDCEKDRGAE